MKAQLYYLMLLSWCVIRIFALGIFIQLFGRFFSYQFGETVFRKGDEIIAKGDHYDAILKEMYDA